ncbi:hypothetical protein IKS57_04990 [bacterium]|nr:hypothetical protein [bacterium]
MKDNKQLDFDSIQAQLADYRKGAQETAKMLGEMENKVNVTKQDYLDLLTKQRLFNESKNASDSVYFQNTYSTTQFFDGSLAKDVFPNSGGNTIP